MASCLLIGELFRSTIYPAHLRHQHLWLQIVTNKRRKSLAKSIAKIVASEDTYVAALSSNQVHGEESIGVPEEGEIKKHPDSS